jgi:hypothetical protein
LYLIDELDHDQIDVERLVASIRADIGDLCAMRLQPHTSNFVGAEFERICSAITSMQILASDIDTDGHRQIRVVMFP